MLYVHIETCIERVNARSGHPTLREGPDSEDVIRRHASEFMHPGGVELERIHFLEYFEEGDDMESLLDWVQSVTI